jgi:hypothetical protein
MRLPWHNRIGLAKAAAIFASIFSISLGLCSANALLWMAFSYGSDSWISKLVVNVGLVEAGAMVLSAAGLIAVALVALAQWIHHRFFPNLR